MCLTVNLQNAAMSEKILKMIPNNASNVFPSFSQVLWAVTLNRESMATLCLISLVSNVSYGTVTIDIQTLDSFPVFQFCVF